MVVAIARRGRPCRVAELDFQSEAEVRLREQFYDACSTFRYGDIMALSRALGVHHVTVETWKYKMKFPNWYIAMQVIDWVERGKPMREVAPWQSAVDMF